MPVLRPPDRGNVEAGSDLLLDRLPRLVLSPARAVSAPESISTHSS
jgi:hypothetical protein